jgi:transposase, IS6 family
MRTDLFKWRHYESQITLLCVRGYLRYALSYRDLMSIPITERMTWNMPGYF